MKKAAAIFLASRNGRLVDASKSVSGSYLDDGALKTDVLRSNVAKAGIVRLNGALQSQRASGTESGRRQAATVVVSSVLVEGLAVAAVCEGRGENGGFVVTLGSMKAR